MMIGGGGISDHGRSVLAFGSSHFSVWAESPAQFPAPMETLRSDDYDMVEARPATGVSRKVLGAAAAVGLFCAGGWAGEHFSARGPAVHSHAGEDLQELTQIIAKPERDSCSKTTDDCFATGCCNVVGYNCFTTKPGEARCLKNCTPSTFQSCKQTTHHGPDLAGCCPGGTENVLLLCVHTGHRLNQAKP